MTTEIPSKFTDEELDSKVTIEEWVDEDSSFKVVGDRRGFIRFFV